MSPGFAEISSGVNTRDLLRMGDPTTTAMMLLVVLPVPVLPVPGPVAGVEVGEEAAAGLVLSIVSPVMVDVGPTAGLAPSEDSVSILVSP